MTDAPLSIHAARTLRCDGGWLAQVPQESVDTVRAQLAAAARVPDLLYKIAHLEGMNAGLAGYAERGRDELAAAKAENAELRARLAAAPDLTELRTANENARNAGYGHVASRHLGRVVDRVLAAVPSTGTDGGGES